jgi:hypothetical protein
MDGLLMRGAIHGSVYASSEEDPADDACLIR